MALENQWNDADKSSATAGPSRRYRSSTIARPDFAKPVLRDRLSERLEFASAAPQLSHLAIDQPAGLPHRVDVILCGQDLRTFDVLPLEMLKPILEHCTLPDVWIEGAYLHRVRMG